MHPDRLRNYARLAIRVGVNLQPGQPLVIGYWHDPVLPEHVTFARLLVEEAYEAGASFVHVNYGDEGWLRQTVQKGSLSLLEAKFRAEAAYVEQLAQEDAAFLRIPAGDPELFAGLDATRVGTVDRVWNEAYEAFNFKRTNGDYSWSLVSAPTASWAATVHPELPEDRQVEALWEDILYCSRASGDDPVTAWQEHLTTLRARCAKLNELRIQTLHYEGPGTDLTVELPKTHFFATGGGSTREGVKYVSNMPTEEVYSVPLRHGVNGKVTSTMPLNHAGALIEGIELEFVDGRIVKYDAQKGRDALAHIIEADEGSHYLGEIALVPVNSPIAERGVLFYNTLFDENASCHLAIGKAYPLIEGGRDLARQDWLAHGLNDSLMHVDFMIGSDQLDITATTIQGEVVPILQKGKFVLA